MTENPRIFPNSRKKIFFDIIKIICVQLYNQSWSFQRILLGSIFTILKLIINQNILLNIKYIKSKYQSNIIKISKPKGRGRT